MGIGRWACVGLLLAAMAAASVAAQENEAEFELDVAGSGGRQLLREAEPYDDKKVACHKSKGKRVCVTTCYKRVCRKSAGKVLCRKAKVSCKKATAKRATAKKVDDNPKAHGAGHTRKLQSDADAEVEVLEPETGRQLLRESEPYDDKKVFCSKSKGKKVCRTECRKKVCTRSKSKKLVCSMKACNCNTGRVIVATPKKTPKRAATKPRAVYKSPPAYRAGKSPPAYRAGKSPPAYRGGKPPAYDDHGGKGSSGKGSSGKGSSGGGDD